MINPRDSFRTDWLFYLLVLGYAYLIISMTIPLWFGGGVNIFATYSQAPTANEMIADANIVYWSKTTFLFLTLLLLALRFDYRFAAGFGASFWSISLILIFGPTLTLITVALIGIGLLVQQILRKQILLAENR